MKQLDNKEKNDNFDDIRPFRDDEIDQVLDGLLRDKELLDIIARLKIPVLRKILHGLSLKLVAMSIKKELAGIHDVRSFQLLVKAYMDKMLKRSTTGFTVSGIDRLSKERAHVFISNHRDIALDPALVDYAMFMSDRDTVRIAIGDNLLSKPYASDLMRINKSFIVNRSAKGRQMLAAYKKLSSYIRYSIEKDRHSVWIAQREGRAKDSIDKTEPAVIKMISLSRDKKNETLKEFVHKMNMVPISISYEWDPLDVSKATELYHKASGGEYQKESHEDLASIGRGFMGNKGAIHIQFGTVLKGDFDTPEDVATAMDRQIVGNYVLHPSNFAAYYKKTGKIPDLTYGFENRPFVLDEHKDALEELDRRIGAQPDYLHSYILDIYANPVIFKLALQ